MIQLTQCFPGWSDFLASSVGTCRLGSLPGWIRRKSRKKSHDTQSGRKRNRTSHRKKNCHFRDGCGIWRRWSVTFRGRRTTFEGSLAGARNVVFSQDTIHNAGRANFSNGWVLDCRGCGVKAFGVKEVTFKGLQKARKIFSQQKHFGVQCSWCKRFQCQRL